MEPRTYSISDLAKEYGVTPRAIRLYEEQGLLAPVRAGNRRIYSDRDRVRLRLTLRAKRVGITLAEAKELFDMYDSTLDEKAQIQHLMSKLDERMDQLKQQRHDIDMSILEIERVYKKLSDSLNDLEKQQA
ncbi:MAG: MerR family transcriptional regulator [Proteobacteria bacterium]|nr:MAG: MerR family transcriptional regulator [Pseudomonadota bacterium]